MNKEDCYGCGICEISCPVSAIKMTQDEFGFFYPVTDTHSCISCHLCEKICPSYKQIESSYPRKGIVGRHTNQEVLQNSASGGAFSAILEKLYKTIDSQDLYVAGAAFTEELKVKHIIVKYPHIALLLNSKYILSNAYGCFKEGKELLENGKWLAFSGTPCQVAAFKTLLGRDYERLFCIDIVCHGASSQKVFDRYRCEMEKQWNSQIITYSFHSKMRYRGIVNPRSAYVTYANSKKRYYTARNDPYLKMYYNRMGYRNSCYHCKFSSSKRVSDITLGDAWGIEKLYTDLDSNKGVSCILLNSEKGYSLFSNSEDSISLKLRSVDVDFAINNNQQLQYPTPEPSGNMKFLLNFNKKRYIRAVAIASFPSIIRRILFYIRYCIANL